MKSLSYGGAALALVLFNSIASIVHTQELCGLGGGSGGSGGGGGDNGNTDPLFCETFVGGALPIETFCCAANMKAISVSCPDTCCPVVCPTASPTPTIPIDPLFCSLLTCSDKFEVDACPITCADTRSDCQSVDMLAACCDGNPLVRQQAHEQCTTSCSMFTCAPTSSPTSSSPTLSPSPLPTLGPSYTEDCCDFCPEFVFLCCNDDEQGAITRSDCPTTCGLITCEPTAAPTTPPTFGSCASRCGEYQPSGCSCTDDCLEISDCCPDYESACLTHPPSTSPTISTPTTTPTPAPSSTPTSLPTQIPTSSPSCVVDFIDYCTPSMCCADIVQGFPDTPTFRTWVASACGTTCCGVVYPCSPTSTPTSSPSSSSPSSSPTFVPTLSPEKSAPPTVPPSNLFTTSPVMSTNTPTSTTTLPPSSSPSSLPTAHPTITPTTTTSATTTVTVTTTETELGGDGGSGDTDTTSVPTTNSATPLPISSSSSSSSSSPPPSSSPTSSPTEGDLPMCNLLACTSDTVILLCPVKCAGITLSPVPAATQKPLDPKFCQYLECASTQVLHDCPVKCADITLSPTSSPTFSVQPVIAFELDGDFNSLTLDDKAILLSSATTVVVSTLQGLVDYNLTTDVIGDVGVFHGSIIVAIQLQGLRYRKTISALVTEVTTSGVTFDVGEQGLIKTFIMTLLDMMPTLTPTNSPSNPPTLTPTPSPTLFPSTSPTLLCQNTLTNCEEYIIKYDLCNAVDQSTFYTMIQRRCSLACGFCEVLDTVAPSTPSPTPIPTDVPSVYPTHAPTPTPTRLPTQSTPTTSPSYTPTTPSPTSTPSAVPTSAPTTPPTHNPTTTPSHTPTSSPTLSDTICTMGCGGGLTLQVDAVVCSCDDTCRRCEYLAGKPATCTLCEYGYILTADNTCDLECVGGTIEATVTDDGLVGRVCVPHTPITATSMCSERCAWNTQTTTCEEASSVSMCETSLSPEPCEEVDGCAWDNDLHFCYTEAAISSISCRKFWKQDRCLSAVNQTCVWTSATATCERQQRCHGVDNTNECNAIDGCVFDARASLCIETTEMLRCVAYKDQEACPTANTEYESVTLNETVPICRVVSTHECFVDVEFAVAATPTSDRLCVSTTDCTLSEWELVAPTTTSDRVCLPLTPTCDTNPLTFESVAPAFVDNGGGSGGGGNGGDDVNTWDRVCSCVKECSSDEYITDAPTLTTDRVCGECGVCGIDEYTRVPCQSHTNTQCKTITDCDELAYEFAPPTLTSDRDCRTTSVCACDEFEFRASGPGQDRVCFEISDCEYETTPPTLTSDRVCCLPNDDDDIDNITECNPIQTSYAACTNPPTPSYSPTSSTPSVSPSSSQPTTPPTSTRPTSSPSVTPTTLPTANPTSSSPSKVPTSSPTLSSPTLAPVITAQKAHTCYASGDGHHLTFDSYSFDLRDDCEHVLVSDCLGELSQFSVSVRSQVSTNNRMHVAAVSVTLPSHERLELVSTNLATTTTSNTLAGQPLPTLPYSDIYGTSIRYFYPDDSSGPVVVRIESLGVEVRWNGRTTVTVWLDLSSPLVGRTCGLCGDADGNKNNDKTKTEDRESWKAGTSTSQSSAFSETNRACCTHNADDNTDAGDGCGGDMQKLLRSRAYCSTLRLGEFTTCERADNLEALVENCEIDYCNDVPMACDALWLAEEQCRAVGIFAFPSVSHTCVAINGGEVCDDDDGDDGDVTTTPTVPNPATTSSSPRLAVTTTPTATTTTATTTTTMTMTKPVYALTACNTSTTSCSNSAICKRCLEEVSNGSRAVHCFQTNTQFRLVIDTCVSDCAAAYDVRKNAESAEFGCYVSWLADANNVLQGCESVSRFVRLTQQPPQSCVSSTAGWSSVEIVIKPIIDSSNNAAAANNTELAVMLAIIIFAIALFMIIFCLCRRSKQKDTKADVGITVHDDEYDTVINRVKAVAEYGSETIAMDNLNNSTFSDGYLNFSADTSGYSDKYMDVTSPSLMLSVPGLAQKTNQTGSLTSVLQGKRYLGENMSFKIADVLPGHVSASPMEDETYMTSQI